MSGYMQRKSFPVPLSGGLFITADGARRTIADQWLSQIELLNNATLIRLGYTFCSVEISGQELESVFYDAAAGKLGVLTATTADAPLSGLWIASIVFVPLPAFSPSDAEYDHA